MKLSTASLFASLAASFLAQSALGIPDKIGNGAGVWVCENANSEIFDVMFMDIFEAKREYQLEVPERTEPFAQLVQEKKEWIASHLSSAGALLPHIDYVEKNITWIDDIIISIPDAASRISPHPSTCRQGKWNPVQLVNFTEDYRILVRRDLFTSPMISEVERAAVYLHEGIYSYLRTEYADTTSVRTRAIVGFLFSNLPDGEKLARINKVLAQTQKPPTEPEPVPMKGVMCGLKPDVFSPLYIFEAKTEAEARTKVVEACKKGQNPMPDFPGYPGGGVFPGFPGGGIPGPGMECKDSLVLCEQIVSSERSRRCDLPNFSGSQTYTGYGRTVLEAKHEAMNQCHSSEGSTSCYTSRDMKCN